MPINSSNLPTNRTLKFEDFPGAEQWFANFLQSLNLFMDPVYQILNGGVSYQNLTIPKVQTRTITTPASGNVTFTLINPLSITPSAVLIGNVYESGYITAHPTGTPFVFWHFTQGTIYIDNITNLDASTTYVVTLLVF